MSEWHPCLPVLYKQMCIIMMVVLQSVACVLAWPALQPASTAEFKFGADDIQTGGCLTGWAQHDSLDHGCSRRQPRRGRLRSSWRRARCCWRGRPASAATLSAPLLCNNWPL